MSLGGVTNGRRTCTGEVRGRRQCGSTLIRRVLRHPYEVSPETIGVALRVGDSGYPLRRSGDVLMRS